MRSLFFVFVRVGKRVLRKGKNRWKWNCVFAVNVVAVLLYLVVLREVENLCKTRGGKLVV